MCIILNISTHYFLKDSCTFTTWFANCLHTPMINYVHHSFLIKIDSGLIDIFMPNILFGLVGAHERFIYYNKYK